MLLTLNQKDLNLRFSGMNAAGWRTADVFHATQDEKITYGVAFTVPLSIGPRPAKSFLILIPD